MARQITRFATGVPGLDALIEGGLPVGSVYMVEGTPGAGKTLLASQMCFACAASGGRAIFMTLLTESHDRLALHLSRMKYFDPTAIPERVYLVSAFKALEMEGLEAVLSLIMREVLAREAKVLVLDGFSSAEEAAGTAMQLRKFLQRLQAVAASTRCTIVLINSTEREGAARPERTMVDGIIELSDELVGLRPVRHLRIAKLRGTDPVRGVHTLEISDRGLTVYQRFETRTMKEPPANPPAGVAPVERVAFGVAQLDRLTNGGVPRNSVTMLLGPTGSGKTILGLQFLDAGARNGEPGLYFGFYEEPDDIVRKGRRVGIDLEKHRAEGRLTIDWNRASENSIDILGDWLVQAIHRARARRVFLDGMEAFQRAIDAPERINDVLATMVQYLHHRDISMVYSTETPQLLGSEISIPLPNASQVTHNIIALRQLQADAGVHRVMSVLKLRDSDFDRSLREYEITENGIVVAADSTSADTVLANAIRRPSG